MKRLYVFFALIICLCTAVRADCVSWQQIETTHDRMKLLYDIDSFVDCGNYYTIWCLVTLDEDNIKKYSTAGKCAALVQMKVAFLKNQCISQSLIEEVIYTDNTSMRIKEQRKPCTNNWSEQSPFSVIGALWNNINQAKVKKGQQ